MVNNSYSVLPVSIVGKWLFSLGGALCALLEPTVPFILICTLAVLMDCYTAWSLSRRVKKAYPGANDGKFKSHYAGRVFITLVKVYAATVLAFLIDRYIAPDMSLHLANIVAGAVCAWQFWSMLENESSCNNAKWARIAQRIVVDKAERHFDVDLSELKHTEQQQPDGLTAAATDGTDICGNDSCAYRGRVKCKTDKCVAWQEPSKTN